MRGVSLLQPLRLCCTSLLIASWVWWYNNANVPSRRLTGEEFPDALEGSDLWYLIPYFMVMFYMFLALAAVCEGYFVPAIDIVVEAFKIPNDIAGATLMVNGFTFLSLLLANFHLQAAGGSAPELATSIIGTFSVPPSAVGFGTIVGSAVFNVLFVIGCCALFQKGETPLALTWWPLFRDCLWYTISLITLSVFFAANSPQKIGLAESLILLSMYGVYVLIMVFNQQLYGLAKKLFGITANSSMENTAEIDLVGQKRRVMETLGQAFTHLEIKENYGAQKISKQMDEAFAAVDGSQNLVLNRVEIEKVFSQMGASVSPDDIEEAMQDLDTDHDGVVNFDELQTWYVKSKARVATHINALFEKLDIDKNGKINKDELKEVMGGISVQDVNVGTLMSEITGGKGDECTKEQFSSWFPSSDIYAQMFDEMNEEAKVMRGKDLSWPSSGTAFAKASHVLQFPLKVCLFFTMPDPMKLGEGNFVPLTFMGSIVWLGVFTYIMLDAGKVSLLLVKLASRLACCFLLSLLLVKLASRLALISSSFNLV
jgi:sodium/potassium/calcium exchanger 2